MRATRRWTLGAALCASLALAAPAYANTLVVDDDAMGAPGDCNASTPTYPQIQPAVTAANAGDTIQVCPGSYLAQITVDKSLTILGAKAGVAAPGRSTANESVVDGSSTDMWGFDLEASDVRLDGFTIENVGDGPGVIMRANQTGYNIRDDIFQGNVFGLYANSGSGTQNLVQRNLFRNNNAPGSASGNGIYADQGTQALLVGNNTFVHNDNDGLVFAGPADSVTIQNNRANDNGGFVALITGTNYSVRGNTITDTNPSNNGNQGSSIFIDGDTSGVLVTQNTLTGVPTHAVFVDNAYATSTEASNIDVIGNTIRRPGTIGIEVAVTTPHAALVRNNTIRHAGTYGIYFDSGTNGNQILHNSSLNARSTDCKDDSTGSNSAGTANFWGNDVGNTSDPVGLCRRPPRR